MFLFLGFAYYDIHVTVHVKVVGIYPRRVLSVYLSVCLSVYLEGIIVLLEVLSVVHFLE